jgi:hypothetical protein
MPTCDAFFIPTMEVPPSEAKLKIFGSRTNSKQDLMEVYSTEWRILVCVMNVHEVMMIGFWNISALRISNFLAEWYIPNIKTLNILSHWSVSEFQMLSESRTSTIDLRNSETSKSKSSSKRSHKSKWKMENGKSRKKTQQNENTRTFKHDRNVIWHCFTTLSDSPSETLLRDKWCKMEFQSHYRECGEILVEQMTNWMRMQSSQSFDHAQWLSSLKIPIWIRNRVSILESTSGINRKWV